MEVSWLTTYMREHGDEAPTARDYELLMHQLPGRSRSSIVLKMSQVRRTAGGPYPSLAPPYASKATPRGPARTHGRPTDSNKGDRFSLCEWGLGYAPRNAGGLGPGYVFAGRDDSRPGTWPFPFARPHARGAE